MADSVAGLAALVLKLQERLTGLQKRLDSLQDAVNSQSSLATDLADLNQRVNAYITAEGDRRTAVPAPVWVGTNPAENDTGQLRELAEWVNGHLRAVYGDYLDNAVHDCWAQHPGAVWELGNLWADWHRVYDEDEPSLSAALAWHDRWLAGTRSRLLETMKGCEHRCRRQRPQGSGWGTR